jgi:hypothetical protein
MCKRLVKIQAKRQEIDKQLGLTTNIAAFDIGSVSNGANLL